MIDVCFNEISSSPWKCPFFDPYVTSKLNFIQWMVGISLTIQTANLIENIFNILCQDIIDDLWKDLQNFLEKALQIF